MTHLHCIFPGIGGETNPNIRYRNEFLLRPLKICSRGDHVIMLPNFHKLYVLRLSPSPYPPEYSRSPGTIKLIWVQDITQKVEDVVAVKVATLHLVRYLQSYFCPNPRRFVQVKKIILAPGFREVASGSFFDGNSKGRSLLPVLEFRCH